MNNRNKTKQKGPFGLYSVIANHRESEDSRTYIKSISIILNNNRYHLTENLKVCTKSFKNLVILLLIKKFY